MRSFLSILFVMIATVAMGQSAGVSLTGELHDRTLPVDIKADALTVDQDNQQAVFKGNAEVVQGGLTLSADEISVTYSADGAEIEQLEATGSVFFSNSAEEARAETATYTVPTGDLVMLGGVTLVQGPSQISGDSLEMNILTNIAQMKGNVRTKLVPRN